MKKTNSKNFPVKNGDKGTDGTGATDYVGNKNVSRNFKSVREGTITKDQVGALSYKPNRNISRSKKI